MPPSPDFPAPGLQAPLLESAPLEQQQSKPSIIKYSSSVAFFDSSPFSTFQSNLSFMFWQ
jgi:hypothetical protein